VKSLAKSKICCGTTRHTVELFADGSLTCECGTAGLDHGAAIAGTLALGGAGGVRGCAGLAALVHGAPALAREVCGAKEPAYGSWRPLVEAYRTNPVFVAAIALAAAAREPVHERIRDATRQVSFGHGLSQRAFERRHLRFMWDVTPSELNRFVVASFADDRWDIPYTPDWLSSVTEPVVDGRFVCGRGEDGTLFVITQHPDGEAWWVMPHRLVDGRLVEAAA